VKGKYVGSVSGDDPLHGFLSKITRDQLGVRKPRPAFRVFRLTGSNVVYGYEEKSSRTRLICKFYGPRFGADRGRATSLAHQEYESLNTLRGYQLVGSPHHVIRPLGVDRDINGVLAVEYYAGEQFSQAIGTSIRSRNDAHLFWRLKALAYYLATQRMGSRSTSRSTADTSRRWSLGCTEADASVNGTPKSSAGCAISGGAGPGCGRTSRSGCTVTPPRRTSCSATAWTSPRSTWNA
jgi:hypothetical protein